MTTTDVGRGSTSAGGSNVFRGVSEMAALLRLVDWESNPLGPVESWTTSLRTTVSTLLASRHAMFLWWGPELIQFYNDSYRQSLGPDRHPSALGQQGRECWAEIWSTIGSEVEGIMAGGDSTWHEDHLVPITRGHRVHDVYWSYSYSPVQDDDGSVGGVLVTVQETTRRVVSERRVRLLQELGTGMQHAGSVEEVCDAATVSLSGGQYDVAFALLYLAEPEARSLRLAVCVGLEPGGSAAPLELLPAADDVWPAARALGRIGSLEPAEPSAPVETIVRDLWPEPVCEALTVPLAAAVANPAPHGVVIIGLNPRIPLDHFYTNFVEQLAREIATALDRVRRDDQERQSALAAARAERELLERVFELSPAFLAVLRGPEHIFELANPAFFQVVGHRPIMGRPILEALPEITGQGFVELLNGVYRTGEPFVGNELPIQLQVLPGGTLEARHVTFVYQPLRDAGGAVTGILASGFDVTPLVDAREAAEQARLEAERHAAERDIERRQLVTVLEQAPLGIVIAEAPSGRDLFRNSTVAELFGDSITVNEAGDFSCDYRGFHADGRVIEPEEWPMNRARRGAAVWNEVIEIERRTTGQRREVSVNAAPVRDAEGRVIAAVAMFWDVTEERRTERQLRDVQRVQAVGTLAGGVAHEINNQMTVVLGFGSFVLRALGPDHPQAADMGRVLRGGQRAARVSQQLLAFTRQQVTQPRVLDLNEVVNELRPVLEQLLGADKRLQITCVSEDPTVSADPDQVQQVLINLVANARDATDTGAEVGIMIENVTVEAEIPAPLGEPLTPGRYVRLGVADAGTGMGAGTLARIFDPFFTTKAVGQGTGLGLPMVYGIMRRHGGYVLVQSTLGVGTTMELYWPVAALSDPKTDDIGVDEHRSYAPGGGAVVLVAEDEPMVCALAVRTLEEEGYRVVSAAEGVEALARIESLERDGVRPEIVITDVIMPGINGRQLSDTVQARWPEVRVLFMSGHTGRDLLDRLVPAGAPFLQKPFTPEGLVQAVGALRSRTRQSQVT
ncbi:MAG: PAS domain-containing protein [Gemmatimonadales bacterium]